MRSVRHPQTRNIIQTDPNKQNKKIVKHRLGDCIQFVNCSRSGHDYSLSRLILLISNPFQQILFQEFLGGV